MIDIIDNVQLDTLQRRIKGISRELGERKYEQDRRLTDTIKRIGEHLRNLNQEAEDMTEKKNKYA